MAAGIAEVFDITEAAAGMALLRLLRQGLVSRTLVSDSTDVLLQSLRSRIRETCVSPHRTDTGGPLCLGNDPDEASTREVIAPEAGRCRHNNLAVPCMRCAS
jgi:hypothetical protein